MATSRERLDQTTKSYGTGGSGGGYGVNTYHRH